MIVSNDIGNKHSPVVSVVFLTTKPKKKRLPTFVDIYCKTKSIALCEHVYSVDVKRLITYLGHITENEERAINEALGISLAISNGGTTQMNELQLIKSESFGDIQCDIYSGGDEMFMTTRQLYECLEESKQTFSNRLSRNEYLKGPEFSGVHKMLTPSGQQQETRVFTEDGIYEITMLSESPKAMQFRAWIRKVLKALRTGKATMTNTADLERLKIEAQSQRARAMLLNAQNRTLKTLVGTIGNEKLSPIAVEVFGLKSIQDVTGIDMSQHLPECEKTYSATEVGGMLGISANRVGKLANKHGLKNSKNGITVMDKSPHSDKQVQAFRYNQHGVDAITRLLGYAG